MPHQEHLPQAGRQLAHRGRLRGAAPGFAALIAQALRALTTLFVLWLALGAAAGATPAPITAPTTLVHAEAVRASGWNDAEPPAEGWVPVTLPDVWTTRWPAFDGVVWYRLNWDQPAGSLEAGLTLDYLNMAGTVLLNGMPIARDPKLVEPLTRAWNTPRYWLLAPPLLREGRNTLLVRVSGLAAYTPGLGPVTHGAPALVEPRFEAERLVRSHLQIFGLAITTTLAFLFGAFWLLRRKETAYGLFALLQGVWFVVGFNQVATSPWPFSTTDGWQACNTAALLLFAATFVVFTLRFAWTRFPWPERALWLLAAIGGIDLWLAAPEAMALHRSVWTLTAAGLLLLTCAVFLLHCLRTNARGQRALAPFMAAVLLAATHDTLAFMGVITSNRYYAVMASSLMLLGMALILGARFVHSLRRIENFNTELQAEVDAARAELATTLAQRHALELAHARIGERVNLVSDLHDGLGGMLVGSIATLEHAPETMSAPKLLGVLRNLRDDLRLIIDATGRADGDHTLGELLVPLRHRTTHLLETNGIACRWQVDGIDTLTLSASQSLDLLRFLQEALTNVLKHSGGDAVSVRVVREGAVLELGVRDNGRGFAPDAAQRASGAGLRSLHARAQRLGGVLQIESRPGETEIGLRMPVPVTS